MNLKHIFVNVLWVLIIYRIYGLSFSDSYIKNLHYDTFNKLVNNGNWILFFRDVTSFQKHDEMNVNIDYLAAKYNTQLNVGYVDCSSDKQLCDHMAVFKYPTIKYVVQNSFHDYYGRVSLRSLVEACDSLIADPISVISDDSQFSSFSQQHEVFFMCVYDDTPSSQALLNEFKNATQQLLLYSSFGMTNRPISKLPPIQPPYVIRIEGDEDFEYFTEETQREVSLYAWIRQRTLSILPEYRGNIFNDIVRSNKLTFLVLLDSATMTSSDEITRLKNIIRALPISIKKHFAFAYLDGTEWASYIQNFGVYEKELPCGIVLHERTGEYYHSIELESESIQQYLTNIATNRMSANWYSILRYYFSRFMKVFMPLPFITRVFLAISFTFSLAAVTLKIIFFFTNPQEKTASRPKPEKTKGLTGGLRKRHVHSFVCFISLCD